MKRGFYILLVLVTVLGGISCNKTKSYTDMLKDQQKAIDNFMAEKGFYTISDYPSNGEFKEGQFIQMNGLYVHVIDSGGGDMANADIRVLCRVKGHHLLGDTSHFDLFSIGTDPLEFTFGRSYTDTEILSDGPVNAFDFFKR
ncbi:MAG: DUF4827 domain-containing protein [Tannerellaceae bacterium]|nr:DUF4827 domain-containing protein [Tannerellaceae bacterium]